MQRWTNMKSAMAKTIVISAATLMGLAAITAGVVGIGFVNTTYAVAEDAPAAKGPFAVDGVHSSVVFKIQRSGGAPFYGRFNKLEGSFLFDDADLAKSMIDVTVPTDSVDSNNQGRDRHLKSADFFSAEEFPKMTFKSNSFAKASDKTYTVNGNLTFRGVTKPVTVTVRETGTGPARGGGTAFGADASFTFKRSDFGMSYMPDSLGDEVIVMVGLEGKRS